jgi:hypothetical protein
VGWLASPLYLIKEKGQVMKKNDINRNPSGKPEGFLKEGEYENLY